MRDACGWNQMAFRSDGPREGPSLHYLLSRGLVTLAKKPRKRGARLPRKPPSPAVLVYFIRATTVGLIKIGKADCVHTRFRTIRNMSPDTLQIMGCVHSEDGSALERHLHERFASDRSHGEWFKPSPELLQFIEENASAAPPMRDWRKTRHGDDA